MIGPSGDSILFEAPSLQICMNPFKVFVLFLFFAGAPAAFAGFEFTHPGLLHGREDLAHIKAAVAAKTLPTFAGYEAFQADACSRADYKMRGPMAMVGRNPTTGAADYDSDANAAYQNAVMWIITDNIAHANKAKEIVNAWSATLKSITGRDTVLMAGLGPFKMINAAEILRHTPSGWAPSDIALTEKHFREVIYPVLENFAPFANGNWDTAAMKTMLAIGVFCNDRAIYERALCYYVNGAGDGRLSHYIINETGQCQESGRDQQHTQLGLAHLGDFCEIAWHQGLDLYSYDENLLLKGFEYTAKYNLGESVPFTETLDRTGKYHHTGISPEGRGKLRAIYEQIHHHYETRAGISTPWVKQVVGKIRPEGAGKPGADQVGYGTLLFTNDEAKKSVETPVAPGGVIAIRTTDQISLSWIPPIGGKSYTVWRDARIIAENLTSAHFTDKDVQAGEIYTYVISSAKDSHSVPVSVCAGLPKPWSHQDIGGPMPAGNIRHDGTTFTVEGSGADIGDKRDQFHMTSVPVKGDTTIVARYVPQLSSQKSRFGVMMRDGDDADAAHVSLLMDADTHTNLETPVWNVRFMSRAEAGMETENPASENLPAPAVTDGRLTGNVWLKLSREGHTFIGEYSLDGNQWTPVGRATVPLSQETITGLAVCSRVPISTTVKFDHVAVTNSSLPPASGSTPQY